MSANNNENLADAARRLGEVVYSESAILIGEEVLKKILLDVFDEKNLSFSEGAVEIKDANTEQGVAFFIKKISERLRAGFGDRFFASIIKRAWKEVKKEYTNEEILSGLLELIPEDFLVEARLQYLSRENLEGLTLKKEKQLQKINEGLEETIRTRTLELTKANEALQNSKEALQKQLIAVAAEKKRISAIVSSIGEGVLAVDIEGNIFLANDVASSLLGYEREAMLGAPLSSLLDIKAEVQSMFSLLQDVLQKGEEVRIPQADYMRPDGNEMILMFVATPVTIDEKITGCIIVFRDVTEQKMVEDAKQQFISTAAHQLRTPLSGIKWAISMLLNGKGTLDNTQKVLAMKSFESTNRLIALVNDLLNVGRIESGRLQLNLVSTNISNLLSSILLDLTPQVSYKEIEIIMKPDENLPPVEFDQESMRAVFQNLLENAVRYTTKGGTIEIGVRKNGEMIEVSIKDSGIGIPFNQQKHLFTRFFRATNAVSLEPDGSGLGLYIAKQIVEKHHGRIWFDTVLGKGTTFHTALPIDHSSSAGLQNNNQDKTLIT